MNHPGGPHGPSYPGQGPPQAHGQAPHAYGQPNAYGQPMTPPNQAYGHGAGVMAGGVGLAPAVSMNKWIYRALIPVGGAVGYLLTIWGATDSKVTELLAVSWVPLVIAVIANYVFIYKMWKAIQDGHARTSPGKAVGLLFVPLFNIYWIFQVLPGYATDFNAFVQRHQIQGAKPLSQGLIIAMMFVPVVNIFLFWMFIGQVCDGVNAFSGGGGA